MAAASACAGVPASARPALTRACKRAWRVARGCACAVQGVAVAARHVTSNVAGAHPAVSDPSCLLPAALACCSMLQLPSAAARQLAAHGCVRLCVRGCCHHACLPRCINTPVSLLVATHRTGIIHARDARGRNVYHAGMARSGHQLGSAAAGEVAQAAMASGKGSYLPNLVLYPGACDDNVCAQMSVHKFRCVCCMRVCVYVARTS